jgi:hypothetical protein
LAKAAELGHAAKSSGTDMSRFPTAGHLLVWADLCSGAERKWRHNASSRLRKGSPSNKHPANIAASVRARLLNLARQTNQPFDVLLTRFVRERLLYRLSRSSHADRLVLKGAMLLTTWLPETAPGTRDVDLLGLGLLDLPAPRLAPTPARRSLLRNSRPWAR